MSTAYHSRMLKLPMTAVSGRNSRDQRRSLWHALLDYHLFDAAQFYGSYVPLVSSKYLL